MPRILNAALMVALALFTFTLARAQILKSVEIEWSKVPQAAGYIVELKNKNGADPLTFTTTEAYLKQFVAPGTYELRIRSRGQKEDVYSPWSKPVDLQVVTKAIALSAPTDDQVFETGKATSREVEFRWTAVDEVRDYILKIWSEEPGIKAQTLTLKDTHKTVKLAAGHRYQWKVAFDSGNAAIYAQSPTVYSFSLLGDQLSPPSNLEVVQVDGAQMLRWKGSEGASAYHVTLLLKNPVGKRWKIVAMGALTGERGRSGKLTATPWNAGALPEGDYKVEILAQAPGKIDSAAASLKFAVSLSESAKPTEAESD